MNQERNKVISRDPEIRCQCGQLLARWRDSGIEVKCKRCRRVVMIPFTRIIGKPPGTLT